MAVDKSVSQNHWPAAMSNPGRSVRDVTPSDTTDLPDGECRGLYCATAGNVEIIAAGDTTSATLPVLACQMLGISVIRVRAAGTTATVKAIY